MTLKFPIYNRDEYKQIMFRYNCIKSIMYFWPAALTLCGYGRWHWLLALCCGWANAADAVEILCTSFLLPSAEVGR